jgi:hypothetical protein
MAAGDTEFKVRSTVVAVRQEEPRLDAALFGLRHQQQLVILLGCAPWPKKLG